ncbi:MAG: hypothetical protein M3063_11240 [Actinomycetota bacterium]|nr:hypothetical protein [Actinomycetota bacterium]
MVVGLLGLGIATYIAFVIIAAVVLVLAGYLIAVAYVLTKVTFTLGTVIIGVRSIAMQTEPVEEVVSGIAADVATIQMALRDLLPSGRPARRIAPRRPVTTGRPRGRVRPAR